MSAKNSDGDLFRNFLRKKETGRSYLMVALKVEMTGIREKVRNLKTSSQVLLRKFQNDFRINILLQVEIINIGTNLARNVEELGSQVRLTILDQSSVQLRLS